MRREFPYISTMETPWECKDPSDEKWMLIIRVSDAQKSEVKFSLSISHSPSLKVIWFALIRPQMASSKSVTVKPQYKRIHNTFSQSLKTS